MEAKKNTIEEGMTMEAMQARIDELQKDLERAEGDRDMYMRMWSDQSARADRLSAAIRAFATLCNALEK